MAKKPIVAKPAEKKAVVAKPVEKKARFTASIIKVVNNRLLLGQLVKRYLSLLLSRGLLKGSWGCLMKTYVVSTIKEKLNPKLSPLNV